MKADLVPVGILINFEIKREKRNLWRELYGYKDYSYYGKHIYKRKGILSNISYIEKDSGVIVKTQDSEKIKNFLKKHKIKFSEHIIILHKKEAKKLQLPTPNNLNTIIQDLKGSPDLLLTIDF